MFKALFLLFALSNFAQAATVSQLESKINILAEEIEKLKLKDKNPKAEQFFGLGQSASAVYAKDEGISIGGYGELVLNMPSGEREDGAASGQIPTGEALRGILYFGNKFSDQWVLNTEIEIEHTDEIFLEFAYLDYLHSEKINFRSGLLLIPMGFVNESHEPIYFNSVNRPEVESKLIPSTWRELGMGIFGRVKDLTYKAYLVNGFNADGFSSDGLRGGRKKGGVNTNASTTAGVFRADYQATDNLLVGGAIYTGSGSAPINETVGVNLYQAHFDFNYQGFYSKALYVRGKLDNTLAYNNKSSKGLAKDMQGYYGELGYNFNFKKAVISPFFRYEVVDTQKEVLGSVAADNSKDRTNMYFGLAVKPIDRIVYKLDYVKKENETKTGIDEINFGIGYLF